MIKKHLLFGFILGILSASAGCFLFIIIFTKVNFIEGLEQMKTQNLLGKVITLGCILNLVLFGILLKLNKEIMARGVVMSVIIIAIITILV